MTDAMAREPGDRERRGLDAPIITGGEDADPEGSRRDSRVYGRLLLLMVLVIVVGGAILSILTILISAFHG